MIPVVFDCICPYEADLLAMGKPFGIEIIRPAELLRRMGAF